MDELLDVIFRPIVAFFRFLILDIGLDLLIKLPGWLLKKTLWPPNWRKPVDADDWIAVLLGLAFWGAVFMLFTFEPRA